jgi:hypothetical protein
LIGTIFMGMGVINLTPELIAQLARPRYDYNPYLLSSIADQKAEFIIGICCIGFAFLIQTLKFISSFINRKSAWKVLMISIVCMGLFGFGIFQIKKELKNKYEHDTKCFMARERINDTLGNEGYQIDDVTKNAELFFEMSKKDTESEDEFIKRYLEFIGLDK